MIDSQTEKNIEKWLEGAYDTESKNEIKKLQRENPQELINAFYKTLHFGTGGLRGIMGVGTNRINLYTIRAATQGLSHYILKQAPLEERKKVLIGFDCRHNSKEFAQEAARVLAANGIEVYLYKTMRPVANISFGLRYCHCIAAIMITASHNPAQYNGYKVYWSYGGQVLPPHDLGIIEEVNRITEIESVKIAPLANPLIHEVEEEIDRAYLDTIRKVQIHPEENAVHGKKLKVIYTNLHGSGLTMVPQALQDWGFTNLSLVEEQAAPDGHFPTVKSPNPEDAAALALGVQKLNAEEGDILLATDPDADRLAVVVMHQGRPIFCDGQQIACLLLEHVCFSLKKQGRMPPKPACIKTIVTSELFSKIATRYGVACFNVLTGFKYIGEKIHRWETEKSDYQFLMGAEESYGYLIGTHARDKDAIVAAACICEAALQMKLLNKTLIDLLDEIYLANGVFREKLISLHFEGKEGGEKMERIMETLRRSPPQSLGKYSITHFEDYWNKKSLDMRSGQENPLLLPRSNVLRFSLTDHTTIAIRPSGTEPKIKIYAAARAPCSPTDSKRVHQIIESCDATLDRVLSRVQEIFLS
jgi:phosphomannomutase